MILSILLRTEIVRTNVFPICTLIHFETGVKNIQPRTRANKCSRMLSYWAHTALRQSHTRAHLHGASILFSISKILARLRFGRRRRASNVRVNYIWVRGPQRYRFCVGTYVQYVVDICSWYRAHLAAYARGRPAHRDHSYS